MSTVQENNTNNGGGPGVNTHRPTSAAAAKKPVTPGSPVLLPKTKQAWQTTTPGQRKRTESMNKSATNTSQDLSNSINKSGDITPKSRFPEQANHVRKLESGLMGMRRQESTKKECER